jgi:class 3 adenylate cyclase
VELPGNDHIPWIGDADAILDLVQEFLTGVRGPAASDRVLATVLFTDIVGSTDRAVSMGDQRWHELLNQHDRTAQALVEQYRGRLIKSTGDGILATFDGPARAVQCARALRQSLEHYGLQVRAGIHVGEIVHRGEDVAGVAVHVAARIEEVANAGEILVSRTVTDLVAGSGLNFDQRGAVTLAGLPEEVWLAAVAN